VTICFVIGNSLRGLYPIHAIQRLFALMVLCGLFLSGCTTGYLPNPTPPPEQTRRTSDGLSALDATRTAEATPGIIFGPVTNPTHLPAGTRIAPTPTPRSLTVAAGATATFGAAFQVTTPVPPTATPTASPTETTTPLPTMPALPTLQGGTTEFGPIVPPNYTPQASPTPKVTATLGAGALPPVVTPGPSPTAGGFLRRNRMGIHLHNNLTDEQFARMLDFAEALGVRWIKVQISWKLYEPERGILTEAYRGQVLNLQRASIRGFKVMLSIAQAPDWARPAAVRGIEDGPPDDPAEFAVFVGRLVRDVKPEFIDAIELWNEPNLSREWRGKAISGGIYMTYFRAGYEAILAEQIAAPSATKPDHRIMVITAGPAPTITFTGSTVGDREFIGQLYDAGLATFGEDVALGAHPYGWGNPPEGRCCDPAPGVTGWYEHPSFYFRETLDAYRDIMRTHGHTRAKVWVTEFGWASYDGLARSDGKPARADPNVGWQALINQTQQADYIVRAFRLAQQPPYYDYVAGMILWNLNYTMIPGLVDAGGEQAGFSLLDANGNPRPAFTALKNEAKE